MCERIFPPTQHSLRLQCNKFTEHFPYTHREIFPKFYQIKPKSDWIYHFQINFEPNEHPFRSKSIGKW